MRIALIEDDGAVLRSLTMLLQSRGITVKPYPSAEMFLTDRADEPVDCIVSDIRMPGMSGLELQNELKEQAVGIPVILITGHGDVPMAVRALKNGAFDFIEKPFDEEELLKSIFAAAEARQKSLVEHEERAALKAKMAELSPRQREVMLLVAEGLSNKEIAGKLQISPRTVENYRAWVMEKTGASNLADLVRMVMAIQNEA